MKCEACNGTGDRQPAGQVEACHECGGSGAYPGNAAWDCPDCQGKGTGPRPLRQGDNVRKVGGDYAFEGVVVARFCKVSGKVRFVVEDDRGILHIFSGRNLEKR